MDMLNQQVNPGDTIVYSNYLYTVISIRPSRHYATCKLLNPSPSTRNKLIYLHSCIVVTSLIKG